MNKRLAEKIAQIDYKTIETLKEYIEYRVNSIHNLLETSTDQTSLLQGKIQELRKLSQVRDTAINVLSLKD